MCIWQWIQANESFLLFLATIILAVITFFYMLYTKKMAKSMEAQTAIMVENYERNIAPIFRSGINTKSESNEEVKIRYLLYNFGKERFTVTKVSTKIWNIENSNRILQNPEDVTNIEVLPNSNPIIHVHKFPLNSEVSRFYPDKERRIKYETTFIVKDVKDREHSFPAGMRSLF